MEHSSPLFLTSSFMYNDAETMRAAFADEIDVNIYTRFSNPNVQEFVDRMTVLEGAESGYATGIRYERHLCIVHGFIKIGRPFCLLPFCFWKYYNGH
ncbi:MAG: PLP-dependent transferase [Ferruginibacter sp.]